MTHPGPEYPAPGQPSAPAGGTPAPQAEPEKKSNTKKLSLIHI